MNSHQGSYRFYLFFAFLILTAPAFAGICPPGDIDKDCVVDMNDLAVLATQWLNAEICEDEPCADIIEPIGVDFFDYTFLAYNWLAEGSPLYINEFMASNTVYSGISDPYGDFDDWIEIYNTGEGPIDLAGIYLTDDLDDPTKWQFPTGYTSQTTVPAGGFVLIWADEEPSEGPLHTNFKLSGDGEKLGLFASDGSTLIDVIVFGAQTANLSYGRYPDAGVDLRFFSTPTPLANNNGAYLGVIEDVEFSHERGFYEADFDVTIATTTGDVNIYYTLDGSDPVQNESPSGILYTSPVPITTTRCLRAAAIKTGYKPTTINTHTYIFIDDVAQQPDNPAGWPSNWGYCSECGAITPSDYEMDPRVVDNTLPGYSIRDALLDIPTVSIAMEPDDFISDAAGLWANPDILTEYKCSIEYIPLNDVEGFQVDCKVENHGGSSRRPYRMQKHNLRLTFTSQYGPSKLEYPLFAESPVEIFNQLLLRASFTDSWGLVSWGDSRYRPNDSQYTRDVWMKESLRDMGQPSSYGHYVHVYVNGLYFGVFNLTERVAAGDFFAEHFGGEPEDWAINKDFDYGDTPALWYTMMDINPSTQAGYLQIQNYLDVENFADYILLHLYADCEDWPGHNGHAAANPVSGDGKFRFFVWDQEIALDYHGRAAQRVNSQGGAGTLFQKMRTSSEFRVIFGDRVQKHCFNGGALSVSGSQNRYLEVANMIDKAIVAESARWGDVQMSTPYGNTIQQPSPLDDINHNLYPPVAHGPDYYFTREDSWIVERDNVINNYIPAIHNLANSYAIIRVLRNANPKLFPSIDAPVFNVNGVYKFGGYISAGDTFTITDPGGSGGTIYYTIDGNDPRVPFTGAVSASAIQYTGGFNLDKSAKLRSRIYKSGTSEWSAINEAVYEVGSIKDSLRITELMFNPQDTGEPNDEDTEFIELKNTGGSAINLNLVKFDKGIDFTFGPVSLAAGQHILVVKDIDAFTNKYGTGRPIAGQYPSSLDNGGERLRLVDALGTTVLDFEYDDKWRSISDGDGYTLTIINPANPDANSWKFKDNWRASVYVNGSPGWDDSGIIPNPGAIVINEIMAHSSDEAPDWVELYNTTSNPINIGGWHLSDKENSPMKYRFAAGTIIPPNGYLIVSQDVNFGDDATDPGRLIPFALSENGELVLLTSALDANSLLTGYREKEDFGASEAGVSFGRYYKSSTDSYNFVPVESNTPGYANSYPKVCPIVITEIMYHPDWPAGGNYPGDEYEYIEIRNTSDSPFALYDYDENAPWKFTSGIDFTFPPEPDEAIIPAGGRILIVKNPTAFNWRYPSVSVPVYGPYDGKLANEGEQFELGKPGEIVSGKRQYIRVERVNYSDGSHPADEEETDPWPTQADGQGKSLARTSNTQYANDPNNWTAATPTPGS